MCKQSKHLFCLKQGAGNGSQESFNAALMFCNTHLVYRRHCILIAQLSQAAQIQLPRATLRNHNIRYILFTLMSCAHASFAGTHHVQLINKKHAYRVRHTLQALSIHIVDLIYRSSNITSRKSTSRSNNASTSFLRKRKGSIRLNVHGHCTVKKHTVHINQLSTEPY